MLSPDALDQVDWAALSHAYGSAEDVPDLIRALYLPDAAALDEAVHELFGTVHHQGSVYPASGPAVPFLAHAARHGAGRRADLLLLLALMAGHEPDQVGSARWERSPVAGVCAELSRALPDLLPCLADPDPAVRQAALRVVAAVADLLPDLDGAASPVAARYASDPAPPVRADAVLALGALGHPAVGLDHEWPEVRLAAAVLIAERDGPPYPPEAVSALSADGARPPWGMPWADGRNLDARLTDLLALDPDAALAVAARWIAAGDEGTRGSWLAERIVETWRDREPEVLELLVAALPHQRDGGAARLRTVAHWIEHLPAPHAALRDTLHARAAASPSALLGLLRARDPRALDLLPADPDPQLLAEAVRLMPSAGDRLIPLVRRRLAAADHPDPSLVALLPTLGEPARAAVPELLARLRTGDRHTAVVAARTLRRLGTATPELLDAEDLGLRLAAAVTHHHLTGDAVPALAAFRELLTSTAQPAWEPADMASLGAAAAPLLPLLEPLLTSRRAHQRLAAADAHHRLTGSPDRAVPVLAALVAPDELGLSALHSLAAAGPLPDSLRPLLRGLAFSPHRLAPDHPLAPTGGGHTDRELRTLALSLLTTPTGREAGPPAPPEPAAATMRP
ncbi:HEAT repeat domain-containing protein [Kitasatospora sp. NPDC059646]|uniref:HEAT repeat domain-containing protein n=1 Tax=Kitasatospora sp. NPDC059646 TaxID=3346893 RepID=UPI003679AEF7